MQAGAKVPAWACGVCATLLLGLISGALPVSPLGPRNAGWAGATPAVVLPRETLQPLPRVSTPAAALPSSIEVMAATVSAPMSPPARRPALVSQGLPNCSVVFFHHLEKTAGTTVRSILQRHAQLGEFELMSFVNRFDKLQFQMVFHRLWTLLRQPGGLAGLRLAVEIHIGGHLRNPYFLKYTLPDLLLVRDSLRAAGCRCHLVTMLRHPLLQHLSWHYHFCNHRVPLCFWNNPPDCQARMAMGMTCHDGPHLEPLRESHAAALSFTWRTFDLVGVTEMFDEFVLELTDLVGLQRPAYRKQIVSPVTLAEQDAQRKWTARSGRLELRRARPRQRRFPQARAHHRASLPRRHARVRRSTRTRLPRFSTSSGSGWRGRGATPQLTSGTKGGRQQAASPA